jgi:hypothetical protein
MRAVDSTPPSPSPVDAAIETPVLHRSLAVATWGCMTINVWNGAVRPERVAAAVAVARDQVARHPSGGGFTIVVGRDTGLPDTDVRRQVADALREMGGFIHCAAVVVEGTGVLAATTRSIISLVFRASNRHVRLRVFGSIEEAAAWQAENVETVPRVCPATFARVLRDITCRQAQMRYAD